MITGVEFWVKKATWSRYMATDKLYANHFFIEIDLDWLELAKNWAWFQKIEYFKNENNHKVSLIKVLLLILYSSMKKIRQIRLIFDIEKWLWKPKIFHLLGAPINPNQFRWKIIGVYFISEHIPTPCSLFGPKLHNCNHATTYLYA